ncbi:hypothetical protein S40288_10762 [Stachybotrys chartarum IBT 40288]|nr:hypothetical protein S40288_10762 [Stachybotrys chartarum IBT 40288]
MDSPLDASQHLPPSGRPRLGRPRMKDAPVRIRDEASQRKERQRLAQRSYRNRRQNALQRAEARAEKLEVALGRILQSLENFQGHVIARPGEACPTDILVRLSKTAMEVATISQDARSPHKSPQDASNDIALHSSKAQSDNSHEWDMPPRLTDNANYTQPLQRWLRIVGEATETLHRQAASHPSLIFKLLEAFMTKAVDVLSSKTLNTCIPAALLGFQDDDGSKEAMLAFTLRQLRTSPQNTIWTEILCGDAWLYRGPKLFRVVEGETNIKAPRSPSPNLQRLRFGRTRTVMETDIPHLMGEWLEASDVVEYLAERGIVVREHDQRDVLELTLPSTGQNETSQQQSEASLGDFYDVARMQTLADVRSGDTSREDPSRRIIQWNVEQASINVSDDSTRALFGRDSNNEPRFPTGTFAFTPSQEETAGLRNSFLRTTHYQDLFDESPQTLPLQGGLKVDLKRLVKVLADHAICMGPSPGVRRASVDLAIRESVFAVGSTAEQRCD